MFIELEFYMFMETIIVQLDLMCKHANEISNLLDNVLVIYHIYHLNSFTTCLCRFIKKT